MASRTDICNMALSHLGISKEIGNVDTERSAEANACRRFYSVAREAVLKDYSWPFASKFFVLNLIQEDPNTEWKYSYRYPNDCLYIRRILSGVREDTELSRIVYKIAQDDSGFLVYTDQEDAEIEYTVNFENEDLFPSDFILALSFRLAAYIAPRITAGDPFGLAAKSLSAYVLEVSRASANAFNEDKNVSPRDTESIAARG